MTETGCALSSDWGEWETDVCGKYETWSDHRGIYTMRHPWKESAAGDYAQVSRVVRLPDDWDGPVYLHFFATDDHHGVGYDPADWPHYVGADIFWGHRFAQVLIDDRVVWEQDVAESDSPGWRDRSGFAYTGFRQVVDLTGRITPGQAVRLALRILDRVGSGERLTGDVHQAQYWEPPDLDRAETNRCFDFTAWWGDVTLAPVQSVPEITYETRLMGALVPEASGADTEDERGPRRVTLRIQHADLLPDMAYPLWGGLPFPRGTVSEPDQIRLLDDGEAVPSQVTVLSRWLDDNSVQWAWVSVMARAGQTLYTLECGPGVGSESVATGLHVCEGERIVVDTGAARLVLPVPGETCLAKEFALADGVGYGPVTGRLNQQMLGWLREHETHCEAVVVEEGGPVRASVKVTGYLIDAEGNRFGRFVARWWAWAESPLLSLTFRVFQDTDQRVAMVDDFVVEVRTPPAEDVCGGFSVRTFDWPLPEGQVRELELRQSSDTEYAITGRRSETLEAGDHAPGWVVSRRGVPEGRAQSLACGVRWFWQQAPKTLTVTPDRILLGLFQRRGRDDWDLDSPIYYMTRGEAKRHQIWLLPHVGCLTASQLGQIQTAWDARPHLMSQEWFAESGVLGNIGRHGPDQFADLDAQLRVWDESELGGVRYGIRDFRETKWCQNYRGRAANGLLEYISSGRPQWQTYFEQVMAHNLDVDTIHFEPEMPCWVGAIRSYSPYHTTGEASHGINTNCQDQFLHYYFVGEPDSIDEARMAADYIARLRGDQGRSSRQEGWPLAQMSMAYLWTGEERYLRAAEGFLTYAQKYTHPRRGAYDEIHSTFSNRGMVPFLTGYLGFGLLRFHECTGDTRAASLLVALTEALISETGDGRGGFTYSPCPAMRGLGPLWGTMLVGAMAAYAYRLTREVWYAERALECYERIVTDEAKGLDMAPILPEMLAGLSLARREGAIESTVGSPSSPAESKEGASS